MWDENEDESVLIPPEAIEVDLATLADGRCKMSTWRVRKPQHPTYEHHFGVGGFNRCVGSDEHVNRLHKDEWGNVFVINPEDGTPRVVRREMPPGAESSPDSPDTA